MNVKMKKLICKNYVSFTGYNCLNGGICTACSSFHKISFIQLVKRGLSIAVMETWFKCLF